MSRIGCANNKMCVEWVGGEVSFGARVFSPFFPSRKSMNPHYEETTIPPILSMVEQMGWTRISEVSPGAMLYLQYTPIAISHYSAFFVTTVNVHT